MFSPKNPHLNRRVTVLKALGHPSRLWIVTVLMKKKASVQELQKGLDQDISTVSRHLLVLRNAGLVRFDRQGPFYIYHINCEKMGGLIDALDALSVSPRAGVKDE